MEKNKIRILLAEDDANMGVVLDTSLKAKGFDVILARNGAEAVRKFADAGGVDLVILDVMMPEKDGFTAGAEIKTYNKNIPMIFLTAKAMQDDILRGFEIGADDYITKPFSIDILLARINAILMRSISMTPENGDLKIGAFVFDFERGLLHISNDDIKLTTREAALLKMLVENRNGILDRKTALDAIWGNDDYFSSRSMDVYITKLRKILKQDPEIELLNVHGKGYKLLCP